MKPLLKEESASLVLVQSRLQAMQDELDFEKDIRVQAERRCLELQQDLDHQIDEGAGTEAVKLCRRKEEELAHLRKQLDETIRQSDESAEKLKDRHHNEQDIYIKDIEGLKKTKLRLEKEKTDIAGAWHELADEVERLKQDREDLEKSAKEYESLYNVEAMKVSNLEPAIQILESAKAKMTEDLSSLRQSRFETEKNLQDVSREKIQLDADLSESKGMVKAECKVKLATQDKLEDATVEINELNKQIEEEVEEKNELKRKLNTTSNELEISKSLHSNDVTRIEELEDAKRILTVRSKEAEELANTLQVKLPPLEKLKKRLMEDNDQLHFDLDRTQVDLHTVEKANKKSEQEARDWMHKYEISAAELEALEKNSQDILGKISRIKAQYEDVVLERDTLRRENRKLTDEYTTIREEYTIVSAKQQNLEDMKRRLEGDNYEIRNRMEDMEGMAADDKNKNQRLLAELVALKKDMEIKLEKAEEETTTVRRNMQVQIEGYKENLEAEVRVKVEQTRQRKKFEEIRDDVEHQLQMQTANNLELQRTNKKLQQDYKELDVALQEEKVAHDNVLEDLGRSDRKLKEAVRNGNEAQFAFEQADRDKKIARAELDSLVIQVDELQVKNAELTTAKQNTEKEYNSIKQDIEENEEKATDAEEKAKKIFIELERLQGEYSRSTEALAIAEVDKENSDRQLREIQRHLDDVERVGIRQLKGEIRQLERKAVELESALNNEQGKADEAKKFQMKSEKRAKSLEGQLEDERKATIIAHDRGENLNIKMKRMREQLQMAEAEVAALTAKHRKLQSELDDAEDRAEAAHSNLLLRTRGRSKSSGHIQRSSGSRTPRRHRDEEEDVMFSDDEDL